MTSLLQIMLAETSNKSQEDCPLRANLAILEARTGIAEGAFFRSCLSFCRIDGVAAFFLLILLCDCSAGSSALPSAISP